MWGTQRHGLSLIDLYCYCFVTYIFNPDQAYYSWLDLLASYPSSSLKENNERPGYEASVLFESDTLMLMLLIARFNLSNCAFLGLVNFHTDIE